MRSAKARRKRPEPNCRMVSVSVLMRSEYEAPRQKEEGSIDQPLGLLAQPGQDARACDADGVGRQAQVLGHGGRRLLLEDQQAEGAPRRRLELRLDQLQQPA